jgi:DNA adenine methylase
LDAFVERLRGVIIENKDACEVMKQHDGPETLHYVDPPYPQSTRVMARGNASYAHEMTDTQHRELAETLHSLKGMVILSGYACDLYDTELYAGWDRIERTHFADGASKRTEVVWMNEAAAKRSTPRLFANHTDRL